jgi:hypothetical protein
LGERVGVRGVRGNAVKEKYTVKTAVGIALRGPK